MATATTLPDTHELERELHIELEKFEAVQKNLDEVSDMLRTANSERKAKLQGIPDGRSKPEDIEKIDAQIRRLQITVDANTPRLAAHRARVAELREEIAKRQKAAADLAVKVARQKAYGECIAAGEELGLKIRAMLTKVCAADLPQFLEVWRTLVTDFVDLGGQDAAARLWAILVKPARKMEADRKPEVYLAELEAAGWTAFGYDISDRKVIPGTPPCLWIVPMRPKQ